MISTFSGCFHESFCSTAFRWLGVVGTMKKVLFHDAHGEIGCIVRRFTRWSTWCRRWNWKKKIVDSMCRVQKKLYLIRGMFQSTFWWPFANLHSRWYFHLQSQKDSPFLCRRFFGRRKIQAFHSNSRVSSIDRQASDCKLHHTYLIERQLRAAQDIDNRWRFYTRYAVFHIPVKWRLQAYENI